MCYDYSFIQWSSMNFRLNFENCELKFVWLMQWSTIHIDEKTWLILKWSLIWKGFFFFFFLDGLLSVFCKKTKRLGCNWCYLGSWIIFWLIETKILNLYLLELCFVCVMLPNLSLFCMCNVFMYIYIVSLPLSNSKNLQLKPTFSKEQNPNPR